MSSSSIVNKLPHVIRRLVTPQPSSSSSSSSSAFSSSRSSLSLKSIYAANTSSKWKNASTQLDQSNLFINKQVPHRLAHLYSKVYEYKSRQVDGGEWSPYSRILSTCQTVCESLTARSVPSASTSYDWDNLRSWKNLREDISDSVSATLRLVQATYPGCSDEERRLNEYLIPLIYEEAAWIGLIINQHCYNIARLAGDKSLASEARSFENLVPMKWRVSEILDMSVVDATAITTDKLGQSPHVSIRHMGSDKDDIIMVGSWMHFAIVELLKNAMRATVEATVTGLTSVSDKLPPVQVKWSAREGMLNVLVVDDGVGMSRRARQTAFELFSTSAAPTQITYTYSGNFGPPSHGHGVGLPLTQLYSKMLGGETCVISAPSVGTTVHWTCSI